MFMKKIIITVFLFVFNVSLFAQDEGYLLLADRVFDGESMHTDWAVWVEGNPLDNIKVLEDVSFVMKGGKI